MGPIRRGDVDKGIAGKVGRKSLSVARSAVAQRLFRVYLQQFFYDGFFHADPHPGNLFVQPLDQDGDNGGLPGRPFRLVFVDFGMVGRITPETKKHLRDLAIGGGTRDPVRVVRAYQRMGFLLPGADLELIQSATARVFDRFWGISMGEIAQLDYDAMHELMHEFRDLLYAMPFQVPQDFIYLGRTFGILSGMATQLDPDFNFFVEAEPFARQLISEETASGWQGLREHAFQWSRALLSLPAQLDTILKQTVQGELGLRVAPNQEWRKEIRRLDVALNRLLWGIAGSALLLSGVLLGVNGQNDAAHWLYAGAGMTLLRLLWLGRKF